MAKLIMDLVEGGTLVLEGQKEFIEVSYENGGARSRLGLIGRNDVLFLRHFLRGFMATLPTLSDEMMAKYLPVLEKMGEAMDREKGESSSDEGS